jgi:hypothetical protein
MEQPLRFFLQLLSLVFRRNPFSTVPNDDADAAGGLPLDVLRRRCDRWLRT